METAKDKAQEAYNAVSKFANSNRYNSSMFGEAMIHDHPLLQAYMLGIMIDSIKAMAENDNSTPQNEAAIKLCKEIIEFIGEHPQYL